MGNKVSQSKSGGETHTGDDRHSKMKAATTNNNPAVACLPASLQTKPGSVVPAVVTCQWLAERLRATDGRSGPDLVVLDCTWNMPISKKDSRKQYNQEHVPGAAFFDLDECSDSNSDLDLTLPSVEKFEKRCQELGIVNGRTHVVCYDVNTIFGLYSAPRVWWMFRVFGHDIVSVLQGGFQEWTKSGFAVTDELQKPCPPQSRFRAKYRRKLVADKTDVTRALETPQKWTLIDVRSELRFKGEAPEPTPGIRSGHIEGALNLPFTRLIDNKTAMKSVEKLKDEFEAVKSRCLTDTRIIVMCDYGVSSCVAALAGHLCHPKADVAVYDDSWNGWVMSGKDGFLLKQTSTTSNGHK